MARHIITIAIVLLVIFAAALVAASPVGDGEGDFPNFLRDLDDLQSLGLLPDLSSINASRYFYSSAEPLAQQALAQAVSRPRHAAHRLLVDNSQTVSPHLIPQAELLVRRCIRGGSLRETIGPSPHPPSGLPAALPDESLNQRPGGIGLPFYERFEAPDAARSTYAGNHVSPGNRPESGIGAELSLSPSDGDHLTETALSVFGDDTSDLVQERVDQAYPGAGTRAVPVQPLAPLDPTLDQAQAATAHRCFLCPKSFPTAAKLRSHVRYHTPNAERPFGCTDAGCKSRFVSRKDANTHARRYHKPVAERRHECVHIECNLRFGFKKDMWKHAVTHGIRVGQKPRCPVNTCPRSQAGFARKDHLARHIRNQHPGLGTAPVVEEGTAQGGDGPSSVTRR